MKTGAGLKRLRTLMRQKGAHVFWLPNHEKSGQPATRYLSGFTGSDSHLLVKKNKCYLVTDGRYLVAAKKEVVGCEIVDISKRPFSELLKKALPKTGKKKVLIDGSLVSYSLAGKIKEKIAGLEIINADGCLTEIRRVKTANEIKLLKKAADISCRAFEKFLPFVKVGVTEKQLARKLADLLTDCGPETLAFPPIVASGRNSALPHATPTDRKLRRGDLVIIDFGATYRGYVSDMTRTVAIGKISPRLEKMYEAVREAQEAGCKEARAGVPARAVDSVCRKILAAYNLEKYFTHSTGHGIGMAIHELPHIGPKSEQKLEAGEVITCEPGVYIEKVGGVRIEDSVIITKKGNFNLTARISKKLISR